MLPTPPPTPAAPSRPSSRTTVAVRITHPLLIRWTHWINFPILAIMIWSGLMIYWAASIPGQPASQSYEHRVYRIGIGTHTLVRLFPDSFYHFLHLDAHLTRGLAFHAFTMWIFTLNGLAYVLYLAFSGQWRTILPYRSDFLDLGSLLWREMTNRHPPHPVSRYNPGQRIAYSLILLMAAASILTGVAIWKPTSMHLVTTLCGGYQTARFLHFWITIGFCLFFAIHLLLVLRAGWPSLRAMITGRQIVTARPPAATPIAVGPQPAMYLEHSPQAGSKP